MALTASFTEGKHTAEFLISEAAGCRSRQNIYMSLAVGDLKAGAVLARRIQSVAAGANTGDGTIGSVSVDAEAPQGIYVITCTAAAANSGTFSVVDPNGVDLGDATVGSAFDNVVQFTIADGAADFIVGDIFRITVDMVEYDDTGSDGQQVAYGILYEAVDTTSAAKNGVAIMRDAEVEKTGLQWGTGIDVGEQEGAYSDLASRGIIAR